jgi:hypothetical protein
MIRDYLFLEEDYFQFVEGRKQEMLHEIERMTIEQVSGDVTGLTENILRRYGVSVPVLHPEEKTGEAQDVKIDISRDPTRLFMHTGFGASEVDGTRVTINIPFEGDSSIFRVKPPSYNLNPPRGEVIGNALVCHIEEVGAISKEKIASALSSWLQIINQYLDWHRNAAGETNRAISAACRGALDQRQQKLHSAKDALAGLGIRPSSPRASNVAAPAAGATKSATPASRQFDFFVSYAREDREMVELLVDALAKREIQVWWDKGQITVGDRLSEKIDEGLARSRYGLVIVSPSFIGKRWPTAEIRALHARAMSSGRKVILPVLVDIDHDKFAETYPHLGDIVSTTYSGDLSGLVEEIIGAMT